MKKKKKKREVKRREIYSRTLTEDEAEFIIRHFLKNSDSSTREFFLGRIKYYAKKNMEISQRMLSFPFRITLHVRFDKNEE